MLAEFLSHGADAPSINVFAKENKERKALNEKLAAEKDDFRAGRIEQNLGDDVAHKHPFTWEDLTYTVPVPGGERQLLDHVYGYVSFSFSVPTFEESVLTHWNLRSVLVNLPRSWAPREQARPRCSMYSLRGKRSERLGV